MNCKSMQQRTIFQKQEERQVQHTLVQHSKAAKVEDFRVIESMEEHHFDALQKQSEIQNHQHFEIEGKHDGESFKETKASKSAHHISRNIGKILKNRAKNCSKLTQFLRKATNQLKKSIQPHCKENIQSAIGQEKVQTMNDPLHELALLPPSACNAIPDSSIMQSPAFRELLIHRQVDNDIASEDEDLQASICYMYGELLYSVGEISAKREKKYIASSKNKQNIPSASNIIKNSMKSIASKSNIKVGVKKHAPTSNSIKQRLFQ